MSRLLAIEWDDCEVRYIEADVDGPQVRPLRMVAARLPRHEASSSVAEVAAVLRSALGADAKLPKNAVLVVPREAMLVKQLALPAAPPDELPDMVRFQMLRELNTPLDEAALDFAPLPGSTSLEQQVLAAVLPAAALARQRDLAGELGVRPIALPPRPICVAELVRDETSDRVTSVLLIDFTATAIEFTVLVEGQIAFTRSHRLSEPLADRVIPADVLSREARRTLMALRTHFPHHAVSSIRLLGDPANDRCLAEAVSAQTDLPAEVVDPFGAFASPPPSHAGPDVPAVERGRFAALIGALCAQARRRTLAMDFLNPKRPPVRRSRRKLYTAAAAAVAVLVAGTAYGLARAEMSHRERVVDGLKTKIADLDKQLALGEPMVKSADVVREWAEGEVIWLDELREFSEWFPESRDAYLDQLRLSVDPKSNRGKMAFSAFAKDLSTITTLQDGLRRRREHYRLHPKKNRPSSTGSGYTRQFETELTLLRREGPTSVASEEDPPEEPDKDDDDSGQQDIQQSDSPAEGQVAQ